MPSSDTGDLDVYTMSLSHPASLTSLGLAYHTGLHVLICEECKEGVRAIPRSIKKHIQNYHGGRAKSATPTLISKALSEVPDAHQLSHPVLPIVAGTSIQCIEGLKIKEGVACRSCR